jgi:polyhydroxyalkanoate synthase
MDQPLRAAAARLTGGVSPVALSLAYVDWAQHLLVSPDKQLALANEPLNHWMRLVGFCAQACGRDDFACSVADKRFEGDEWKRWPYSGFAEAFLLAERWWQTATMGVRGVSRHHEAVAVFLAHQVLDVVSPSNYILTNPTLLEATLRQGGLNLVQGAVNLVDDWRRSVSGVVPPPASSAAISAA